MRHDGVKEHLENNRVYVKIVGIHVNYCKLLLSEASVKLFAKRTEKQKVFLDRQILIR